MRKLSTVLILASILAAGSMVAPSIYAHESKDSSRPMMGDGMMGDKSEKDDGGKMGDMMGMMKMMNQMSKMMDQCSNMMSADKKPNDQWRKNVPSEPEKKG
jgi:hypothetical protein